MEEQNIPTVIVGGEETECKACGEIIPANETRVLALCDRAVFLAPVVLHEGCWVEAVAYDVEQNGGDPADASLAAHVRYPSECYGELMELTSWLLDMALQNLKHYRADYSGQTEFHFGGDLRKIVVAGVARLLEEVSLLDKQEEEHQTREINAGLPKLENQQPEPNPEKLGPRLVQSEPEVKA